MAKWPRYVVAAVLFSSLAACGGAHVTRRPGTTTGPTSTTTVPPTTSPTSAPPSSTAPTSTTSPGSPSPTTAPPSVGALFGRVWNLIPTTSHVVALSFDAGANADGVPSILSTLRANGVPATFFLTGNFARSYPSLSRELAVGGYRLGNHSVDHPSFTSLTDAQIRTEVLDAESTIVSVTAASPAPLFRFPFGDSDARTLAVVNGLGYVAVGWTVDTLGWQGTSSGITVQSIVDRVLASLQPGEIVLMHCGSNPTDHSTLDADALPTLVAQLRARGYSFVTLDALLAS